MGTENEHTFHCVVCQVHTTVHVNLLQRYPDINIVSKRQNPITMDRHTCIDQFSSIVSKAGRTFKLLWLLLNAQMQQPFLHKALINNKTNLG